jgi:hypothetical protein
MALVEKLGDLSRSKDLRTFAVANGGNFHILNQIYSILELQNSNVVGSGDLQISGGLHDLAGIALGNVFG